MGELPSSSNFYSSLHTKLSREQVAQCYGAMGWEVRKCSWVDYEVVCDWAELIIESESPILMHGPVADVQVNAVHILEVLRQAQVAFAAESYGPDD